MKNAGLISLLSIPVAVLVCVVLSCFMDTSGFAAIGAGVLFAVLVFVAGMLSLYFGICAIRSRKDRNQGTVGVIFGLLVVGAAISIVLYCYIDSYIEDKHIAAARAAEEKAEKAAYDASPDIESSDITTLLESPLLNVKIDDIATLPGKKILVYSRISGGRSGSKLSVFSMDGTPDATFIRQKAECGKISGDGLLTAPNGNILLAADCMHYNYDSESRWTNDDPAILRNRYGKCIGRIEDSGDVETVRFGRDSKLYGLEWEQTGDGEINRFRINLVEIPFDGRKIIRKTSLAQSVSSRMQIDDYAHKINLKSLFFWPNGDIGLITYSSQVLRIDSSGKRLLSSFKTCPVSFRGPNRFIGFFSDSSLILSCRDDPGNISQYRNGKRVASFSKTMDKLRERMDIQAATVVSTGDLVIAGSPSDKNKIIQFVIIDSAGNVRKGFSLGNDK